MEIQFQRNVRCRKTGLLSLKNYHISKLSHYHIIFGLILAYQPPFKIYRIYSCNNEFTVVRYPLKTFSEIIH